MVVTCLKNSCFEPKNVVFVPNRQRYGQICKGCVYCFRVEGSRRRAEQTTISGHVSWDPHFRTLDGKHFDFMGQCSYYLMKTKDTTIIGKYEICGKQGVTCLSILEIRTKNTLLILGPKTKVSLLYKGKKVESKKPYCNEDLCFYQASSLYD